MFKLIIIILHLPSRTVFWARRRVTRAWLIVTRARRTVSWTRRRVRRANKIRIS